MSSLVALMAPLLVLPVQEPERIRVGEDDLVVDRSCTLVFEDALPDRGEPGVVRITGDGVEVRCEGALHGAEDGVTPDRFVGVGIVIEGEGVTLTGARVSGFRVGIHALEAHGLVLASCDVSGNFSQRLGSTFEKEDPGDWLWPHANDGHEWFENYGAGIYVEGTNHATVRGCRARRGQNGLVLDRVEMSLVHDNDFSFLSGWGIALWRSSRNAISRNALDFCIRGYSHGIYNRGQDSAGLLMFEQCSNNVVAENSITHGGDGVFAFAGSEALGDAKETARHPDEWHARRGNNDNWFARNDLSYAAAHGLELTFSFGNQIFGNRMVENAICGIWGGYSRDTLVTQNLFSGNGGGAYGNERGGINVEHGQGFLIVQNRFEGNACGVHLWWDEDPHLADLPWTRANGFGSGDHVLIGNEFLRDELAIELVRAGPVSLAGNHFEGTELELRSDEHSPIHRMATPGFTWEEPELPVVGDSEPIGARERLIGRARIVVTEWGPFDWESSLLWRAPAPSGVHGYRVLNGELDGVAASGDVEVTRDGGAFEVSGTRSGLLPYEVVATIDGEEHRRQDLLFAALWEVRCFRYTSDPREDRDAWRAEAEGVPVVELASLDLSFGGRGPAEVIPALAGSELPTDRFGVLAHATIAVPAGLWTLHTVSDDGLRVFVDGELVVDDWTHHASTIHDAPLELAEERTLELAVEYFELDGGAELEVTLVPGE